ncbi:MAG TPA: Rap1a/Tai family immunity protein [Rubrivivax sp.]|nr:Rap1a/Tai family immunity protein [Rubrivivax sp.]
MRTVLAAASLALAASAPVMAQEQYQLRTAADLARICSTPASADDYVVGISFCHGVLSGAYNYFLAATPVEQRFVCLPSDKVTRIQIANGFVSWLQARPQYQKDGAIDALFRYAAETYPCKR